MTNQGIFDVAIVGCGIAGAVSALRLAEKWRGPQPLRIAILEAADRVGGRAHTTESGVDLGATWLWPHANYRALHLVCDALKLAIAEQRNAFDSEVRVENGMSAVVDAAIATANASQSVVLDLRLASPVETVGFDDAGLGCCILSIKGTPDTVKARNVIVALPPRLVARSITFVPALSSNLMRAMLAQNIWMGAMAKVAFHYKTPWWRNPSQSPIGHQRIPGSSVSQFLDASDTVLVCFAVPPKDSSADLQAWISAITSDVARFAKSRFGAEEVDPVKIEFHSWRHDAFVFAEDSVRPVGHTSYFQHPYDGGSILREPVKDEKGVTRLFWAGSETDDAFPGYVEGAVRSGERVAEQIFPVLL
ncbi:hypothetical protein BC830DRAFT_1099583 [Chytriomyces sp. MP71]|nr:hypothetical protein BC830DRAFT_1099583 [Chytriomyces sp. MP71]